MIKVSIFSLLTCLFFSFNFCVAQNTEEISIYSKSAKDIYRIGPKELSKREVKELLASDTESLKQFKAGQAWNIAGAATCGAGGVVLISAVGVAIDNSINKEILSGGEKDESSVNWALLGAGIGTMIPGAIMLIHGKHLRIKAVKNYNETISGRSQGSSIYFQPASQGIGITMVF